MATYKATIFNFGIPLNEVYYNTHSVEVAVDKFNNTGSIVTLEDEIPGNPGCITNLDRAAATAKLTIENNMVVATIKTIDTHCGNLVGDLIEHNLLVAVPIIIGSAIGNVIQVDSITKIALVNRQRVHKQSDLARMKDWVNGDLRIFNLYNIEMYAISKIDDK